ncbi:hypothetical protein [Acinetobacter sp. CFCC 11171]|uniref:hypothetical protein n=1 Tax=Acinetobacter sp. CFCC 11171 TaxID=1775558 RepID=UPI000DD05E39|nr:hypothetical protein [Acinetobacter sp. CFCC 11171]
MSNRLLPFYSKFFNTFEKHTIEKWEAKDFILNVLDEHLRTTQNKQRIYQGINVLVNCGYLKKVINPRKKNTYLYSEAERLSDYRSTKKQENIAKALSEKMDFVQESIVKKNFEVDFINGLKDEYPKIASQLDIIEQEHIDSLNNLTTQQNVIKSLMSRFSINEEI